MTLARETPLGKPLLGFGFWGVGAQYLGQAHSWSEASFRAAARSCLTESVYNVVLQKSIPAQIRRCHLHVSDDRVQVGGFVGGLTSAKRLLKNVLCEIKSLCNTGLLDPSERNPCRDMGFGVNYLGVEV